MAGRRHLGVATVIAVLTLAVTPTAAAGGTDGWGGETGDSNVRVSLFRADLEKLSRPQIPTSDGPVVRTVYGLASICGSALPGDENADLPCGASYLPCDATNPEIGAGPAMQLFRRTLDAGGRPLTAWVPLGVTCLPELVPGAKPALTMAMIADAFHDTDFAVPTVNIQPEGDVTLVNLPTFFEVRFPSAGFGPDEVDHPDPARLLGYRIEVRPRLKSVTYHLGDQVVGPTTSLGGPYPNGDVTASFPAPGRVSVRADIVYTGQFRVGGSQWFDIPGEVALQGTPVTLTVREARARLYNH